MTIPIFAICFFGFTTAVFLALYWHQACKNSQLKLDRRLDGIEQNVWESTRAMHNDIEALDLKTQRELERIHWHLNQDKASSKPR